MALITCYQMCKSLDFNTGIIALPDATSYDKKH